MLKLQEESGKAGVLNLDKVRECISPTTKFRDQAAWWINEMSEGQILHAKKREPIDPNTIHSYQNAAAYLNDQIGDVPLASIDNPQAKTIITKMKSEQRKDGQRRFSDKTIVEYFRVLRRVIASVLDENFNSIHHRSWNLAAIGLPRVNLKKQRRPTLTAKEMTTLLSKAEGQYQILYFFCMVTGMRVSEAVAVEIGKHIETDCSIVYVRQQREKSKNCVKAHLKTESGCRDVDIHPNAAAYFVTSLAIEKMASSFKRRTEGCLIPEVSRGLISNPFSKQWAGARREQCSMFFAASVKLCCNAAMHGSS